MRARHWIGIAGIGIGLLAVGAWAVWAMISAPLYTPGTLDARVDLEPVGIDGDRWEVEPGVELAVTDLGKGPLVVVVHGGPGAPPDELAPAFAALADLRRVVTWDQRGSGASSNPWLGPSGSGTSADVGALEAALGIGAQLADLERIRRLAGVERMTVIGHSYGGLLASLYAAELPDRVEHLVLLAPADLLVFPSAHRGLFGQLQDRMPEARRAEYDAWMAEYLDLWGVTDRSTEELRALDARLLDYWSLVAGPAPAGAASSRPGPWHARAQYFSLGLQHDWRPVLGRVTARTLVLWGDEDLQPEAVSALYAEAIPDATMQRVAGAGHFPQYSHPTEVVSMVRAFLGAP